jgi:D-alanine-D-alanine ligase
VWSTDRGYDYGRGVSSHPPIRVAVLYGGRSSEHSISCLSAAGILRALDRSRFDVQAIGITRSGAWVRTSTDADVIGGSSDHLPEVAADQPAAYLLPEPMESISELDAASSVGVLRDVDVVFPVLHGPWGEDGTVQGLLEMAAVPYVGSGVFASAAAMDKGFMKILLAAAGIPVGPYRIINQHEWAHDSDRLRDELRELGLPLFVKPARAGSSVGITRVVDLAALDAAMEEAIRWDPRVIVEVSLAPAREIECAVMTDDSGQPIASVCAEIRVGAGHDFYDFEAKYLDDAADLIVPADLSESVQSEVQRLAVSAFEALGCEGLARVDFFITEDRIVVNEVNTMPGFTPISMFPRMWSASGWDYGDLIDHLIKDALRRGTGLRA